MARGSGRKSRSRTPRRRFSNKSRARRPELFRNGPSCDNSAAVRPRNCRDKGPSGMVPTSVGGAGVTEIFQGVQAFAVVETDAVVWQGWCSLKAWRWPGQCRCFGMRRAVAGLVWFGKSRSPESADTSAHSDAFTVAGSELARFLAGKSIPLAGRLEAELVGSPGGQSSWLR